jgi:hypothetical protein
MPEPLRRIFPPTFNEFTLCIDRIDDANGRLGVADHPDEHSMRDAAAATHAVVGSEGA